MAFSWDEKKREVDFAEAIGILMILKSLNRSTAARTTARNAFRRWERPAAFFISSSTHAVYTWRGETRHIITAWKVREHGKRRYETLFAQRHRRDEGER
jgi:hypothetical protein